MNVDVCRVPEEEYSRHSTGDRWCFTHRKRHEFWWVCYAPTDPLSYFGPRAQVEGTRPDCSDLFPGWERTWDE